MEQTISKEKIEFIKQYIDKLESQFAIYDENLEMCYNESYTFDTISEIINVFKSELPELENSVLFRSGTAD